VIDEAEGGPDLTKYEDVTDEMPSRYPGAIKEAWRQLLVIALDNEEYVAPKRMRSWKPKACPANDRFGGQVYG